MAILRSPIFIICCLLFTVHQLLQKIFNVSLPWADAYLDTILAMPVILSLLLVERQWLFQKGRQHQLTVSEIIITTFYIALITEGLFPYLSQKFTADVFDLLGYATGSLLFYFTINKVPSRSNT